MVPAFFFNNFKHFLYQVTCCGQVQESPHSKNSGDAWEFHKEQSTTCIHPPVCLTPKHCGVLPLSGHRIHPRPQIGAVHYLSNKEGAAKDVLSEVAEVQPAKVNNFALLHCHH